MKTLDLPNGRLQPKRQKSSSDLSARLLDFENQYNLPSEEFYHLFQTGKMGDDTDMFEWSALYQMRLSAHKQLEDQLKPSP